MTPARRSRRGYPGVMPTIRSWQPGRASYPESVRRYLSEGPPCASEHPHPRPSPAAYLTRCVGADWETLRPHLPATARSVLDIGGGVGGLSLFLHHALGRPNLTIVEQARLERGAFCHNVAEAARDFLTRNGVPEEQVEALDAADPMLSRRLCASRFDVIVSLRAIGYRFSYATYRHVMLASLAPGGTLIMDISLRGSDWAPGAGMRAADSLMKLLGRELGGPVILAKTVDYLRVKLRRTR